MSHYLLRASLIASVLGTAGLLAWRVHAETNHVTFPRTLEGLVHYTGRERGNSVTRIMTTPELIETVKQGQPVPNGAKFVLVDYRDGELYRYFVMEKGPDWGAEYDEARRTGDWQFQWFWPDGRVNMDENTNRCQSCHQGASDNDFLFTYREIQAFDGTNPVN